MTMQIYVILDTVSGQTSPLFLAPNDKTAEREFSRFLESDKLPTSKEDYNLLSLGTYSQDDVSIIGTAKYTVFGGASVEVSDG